MTPEFQAWAAKTDDAIWVDLKALRNTGTPVFQDEDGIYIDLADTIGLADVLDGGAQIIRSPDARGFKKKG